MKRKHLIYFLVIGLLLVGSLITLIARNKPSSEQLRICPEHWVLDAMPEAEKSDEDREYFIINGDRVDYNKVNIDWVKQSCSTKQPEYVY